MSKRRKQKPAFSKPRRASFSLARLAFLLPTLSAPAQPAWRWLPALLLLAFVLRAAVALSGDFVIHPDEIMQYLEPAHGLVFGNSVSYWEYYYGARSWLVPSVVAAVLWLCGAAGLEDPAVYIGAVKLFFCALSLLIPLALYVVGRRLFNENTARIALALGVFWYELVGFAHKPMTEFVATSLLCGLLIYVLRPQRLTLRQAALAAAFGVCIAAIRFQYAPVIGLVLLVPFIRAAGANTRLAMVGAAAAALVAVGMADYFAWGGFLHSYWLNLQVNLVLNQYRSEESSPFVFIGWLVAASGGLALAAAATALNPHRRLFLLLLALAILLPHMTQAHREYRFVFALIPLWLLLFADVLALGVYQARKAPSPLFVRARQGIGLGAAALVSVAGIANALPLQYWVYEAKSQETGYVHFIRYQDDMFSVYRQLAADESLRGVLDATRPYFNTGGYYYLHKRVPFYTATDRKVPPAQAAEYVSHIVASAAVSPVGLAQTQGGRLVMQTEGGGVVALPAYIGDKTLGKLVYWDERGQSQALDGFALASDGDKFSIWKNPDATAVREWADYKIAPDSEAMHQVIARAMGAENAPAPAKNLGIQFQE